jgi:hypothetical protein
MSKISSIGWHFDVSSSTAQLLPPSWLLFLLKLQLDSVLLSLLLSPVVVIISSPVKIIIIDTIAIVTIIPSLAGLPSVVSPHVKGVLVFFASHCCPCQFLIDDVVLGEDSFYHRRAQKPTRSQHREEYRVAVGCSRF